MVLFTDQDIVVYFYPTTFVMNGLHPQWTPYLMKYRSNAFQMGIHVDYGTDSHNESPAFYNIHNRDIQTGIFLCAFDIL